MSEFIVEEDEQPGGNRRFGLISVVIAVLLIGLVTWGIWNNELTRPQIGDPAPEVEFTFFTGYTPPSIDASQLDLSDFEGKVVVLNFWASWCIECRVEMPDLQGTAARYGDDVEVIGVAYIDIEDQSLNFLRTYGVTYANAPDLGSRISDTFEITGVPETFVIDQSGQIAASFIGPVTSQQLAAVIDSLLAE